MLPDRRVVSLGAPIWVPLSPLSKIFIQEEMSPAMSFKMLIMIPMKPPFG